MEHPKHPGAVSRAGLLTRQEAPHWKPPCARMEHRLGACYCFLSRKCRCTDCKHAREPQKCAQMFNAGKIRMILQNDNGEASTISNRYLISCSLKQRNLMFPLQSGLCGLSLAWVGNVRFLSLCSMRFATLFQDQDHQRFRSGARHVGVTIKEEAAISPLYWRACFKGIIQHFGTFFLTDRLIRRVSHIFRYKYDATTSRVLAWIILQ